MSNQAFQIVISAAVVLAFASLVVQGFVALALYRSSRNMAARLSPFLTRAKAILTVEKETIRSVEIVIDKTLLCADILERVVPKCAMMAARAGSLGTRAMQIGTRVTELERSWDLVETATHFMSLEMRPRITLLTGEAKAIASSTSHQVRRVSRVFREALEHFTHLRAVVALKQ